VLSLAMLDAVKSNLLHDLSCDVKVIILSANGKVFSSGHDLKELVRLHFHACEIECALR